MNKNLFKNPKTLVVQALSGGHNLNSKTLFTCALYRKAAFTLAEVLISLTILGVVAVISVSTIIQNYQQSYFVTKYRKTFAAFENAFQQYQVENGIQSLNPPNNNNWRGGGSVWPIFNEFFNPYFNATNNGWQSSSSDYAPLLENGEKEEFYIVDQFVAYNKGKGIKLLNGATPNRRLNRSWKLTFRDGVELNIAVGHKHHIRRNLENTAEDFYNGAYFIDVNGEAKGPNIIGRDIFLGFLLFDGLHPLPLSNEFYQYCSDCNNFNFQNMHNNEKCTKNSSGVSCSKWFIHNSGWEK